MTSCRRKTTRRTTITLTSTTIAEGKDGATVGKLTAHDPDAGDSHTYSVSDARFEITADGTLKLKAGQHLDYAAEKTVALTVTATDAGGLSTQKTFTLNVADDPAYPAPNQPGSISITGEAKVGSTLTATVKDADNFDASAVKYQWFADGNPDWRRNRADLHPHRRAKGRENHRTGDLR